MDTQIIAYVLVAASMIMLVTWRLYFKNKKPKEIKDQDGKA